MPFVSNFSFFALFILTLVGMKFLVPAVFIFLSPLAFAWGRHDVITEITLDESEFSVLGKVSVRQESIDQAAPDLVARVVPELLKWCTRYHLEHDSRYEWKAPETFPQGKSELSARQKLLWDLEDNIDTPLPLGPETTAADILVRYVGEPDGLLDGGLEKSPYIERLRESMSYFGGNDAYTHAFRHYYVPNSLLPPILSPQGIAPYRAALYAKLSEGAFDTGHPYWGYRFLAWSIHYVQDVTQPWHTIFLPGIEFLSFSKSKMKHEVSALHYLTEALADAWMKRMHKVHFDSSNTTADPLNTFNKENADKTSDPWSIAELTEKLAIEAHSKAEQIAELARTLFTPVVERLNVNLKPDESEIAFGGIQFESANLDFDGDGSGATNFLEPMWRQKFTLTKTRDQLLRKLVIQLNSAIGGSRIAISEVLGSIHSNQSIKTQLHQTSGSIVGAPS